MPRIQLCTSHLHTLNDFQKLLGDIQWLRPYLKLTTHEFLPLNDILKGNSDPLSPRKLIPESQASLVLINKAIQSQTVFQVSYSQSLLFVICATPHAPTGVFLTACVLIKYEKRLSIALGPFACFSSKGVSHLSISSCSDDHKRKGNESPILWKRP